MFVLVSYFEFAYWQQVIIASKYLFQDQKYFTANVTRVDVDISVVYFMSMVLKRFFCVFTPENVEPGLYLNSVA